jgi:hypothetical protein
MISVFPTCLFALFLDVLERDSGEDAAENARGVLGE